MAARHSVSASQRRTRFRNSYVLVGAAIVEQKPLRLLDPSLDKDHIGDLTGFFPRSLGRENRLFAAPQKLARVVAVEDRDSSPVDQVLVGAVVNEQNAFPWSTEEAGRVPRRVRQTVPVAAPALGSLSPPSNG